MKLRAVIYARVSSSAQRDRDTIESQLRELPAFVAAQGWELVGTYIDDGKSAATGKLDARDGFARLVRDAEAKKFDIVVIRHVDRLTRTDDISERAEVFGPFQRAGVRIVAPSGGEIDLRTMMGQLDATLRALYAAEESRIRRERVISGQTLASQLGRKGTGRTPFGLVHTRIPSGHAEWSLDPVRAPIVREIFERIAAGESSLAIATDFEMRGVVRPGKLPWTRHRVWEIVTSSHPTGAWLVRGGTVTVAVPAIVPPDLVERARAAREGHRKSGLDRTFHIYLLAKISRCGKCGQAIRVRTGFRTWKRTSSNQYRCVGRWSPLPPGVVRCDAAAVKVEDADARAWAAICRELEDPALVPALVALRSERAGDTRTWEDDVAGYKKHLDRLDGVEAALLARFRRGAIGEKAMDAELAAINRERTALRDQVATAERARTSTIRATRRLSDAGAIVARLREKLATATQEERRAIVATLVDPGGIAFHGEQIRLEMWIARPTAQDINSLSAMGQGRLWSGRRETELRIRLVA